MGNRGILHNAHQQIVTPFVSKAWIICLLSFKGRKRPLMHPNRYTELFFLDEATALSAGHRPCWECQRERNLEFKRLWLEANGAIDEKRPFRMSDMDSVLHEERLTNGWLKKNRRKRTYTAVLQTLPNGTFIELSNQPHLLWQEKQFPWTAGGYQPPTQLSNSQTVTVLTPPSTVAVLKQGYTPQIHPTIPQHK